MTEVARCADLTDEDRLARLRDLDHELSPATGRELARAILTRQPDSRLAWIVKAGALVELRLFPEARAAHEHRPETGMEDRLFGCILGRMLDEAHRVDEAEEAEALAGQATEAEHGGIDEAILHLGDALRGQRRFTEALEAFRRAVEMDPDYEIAKTRIEDLEETFRRSPSLRDHRCG